MQRVNLIAFIFSYLLFACQTPKNTGKEEIRQGKATFPAWVYHTKGLALFSSASLFSEVVDSVAFGEEIALLLPLNTHAKLDTLTFDALLGRMLQVQWNGQDAYIFSGFLLRIPPPEKGKRYLISQVELLDTLSFSSNEKELAQDPNLGDQDIQREGSFRYEHDIIYSFIERYGQGEDRYQIPDFSVAQALLYLRTLHAKRMLADMIRNVFVKFLAEKTPTQSFSTRTYDASLDATSIIEVSVDENGVLEHIFIEYDEGCHHSLRISDDGQGGIIWIEAGGC